MFFEIIKLINMNKFFSYTLAVALATASLAGCNKIKDATSINIEVNNVSFDFETEVKAPQASMGASAVMKPTAATNTFSVTRTVDISEISSKELEEYVNKIVDVTANNQVITVTITPTGSEPYTVENLTLQAEGVANSLVVDSYTLGGDFPVPAGMTAYMVAFVTKLLSTKSLAVTVSGMTDAPVGTTVKISYGSDLVLKASLL